MKKFLYLLALLVASTSQAMGAEPQILGRIAIPATLTDKSNEDGTLEAGIPANQWGGFGSGIAWLGEGNRYAVISDRGPSDGKTAYRCRFHVVSIAVGEPPRTEIKVDLLETHLLSTAAGIPLIGSLGALPDANDRRGIRFDPEAIRAVGNDRLLISDEYGPSILEFDTTGRQSGQLSIPRRFLVPHPSADPIAELPPTTVQGRQPNRGLECLAVSPRRDFVYALLQSPLIQDGALDAMNQRVGTNCRLLEINRKTGGTREFLYPLDRPTSGCNEIEYLAPGRFLVIERDGKGGAEAAVKQIVEIDIRQATDISRISSLPSTGIPPGVTPISKRLFLDLLDPRWKLAGDTFPEKIEGIALGSTLKNGSRVLLITSDNDFLPAPTQIYAFSLRLE